MIDHRFFTNVGPFSLERLCQVSEVQTILKNGQTMTSADDRVADVASLEEGESAHLSFFHNVKYRDVFKASKVGFCFVTPDNASLAPSSMVCLVTPSPQRSFGLAASLFYPDVERGGITQEGPIHPTARLGSGTVVGYGAVIGPDVVIGSNCRIGPNAVISRGVVIGDGSVIGAGVHLSHAIVGRNCILYPGAAVGQAGFGFAMDQRGFVTVPQLGRVILEDNVEIGANTTVDRGSLRDTVIGKGSRLDNLVMIGHNVTTGQDCVLVAQVGIAGSTSLGNQVIAAGQVGIVGHVSIGNQVRIAAQSGVAHNIPDGETVGGSPALPIAQHNRQVVTLRKICADYHERKKGQRHVKT